MRGKWVTVYHAPVFTESTWEDHWSSLRASGLSLSRAAGSIICAECDAQSFSNHKYQILAFSMLTTLGFTECEASLFRPAQQNISIRATERDRGGGKGGRERWIRWRKRKISGQCVCVWMCVVHLLLVTSFGPGDRRNKEWLILLHPTWPLSGGAVPESLIQNSEACFFLFKLPGSITDWQVNLFRRNCTANERDHEQLRPSSCLPFSTFGAWGHWSVFSLSGSLSWPYRLALIKSRFSISITACSMRSMAPGCHSPLSSATLLHTTINTHIQAGAF